MSNLLQDLRYALRTLLKSPSFTLTVVLTLALGIGASTSLFSLIYSLFYQPLPVTDARQLVHVHQKLAGRDESQRFTLSFADYLYFKKHSTAFSSVAAHYLGAPMSLSVEGESGFAMVGVVTADFFEVLRLRPALGRFFEARENETPDRDAVTVISESLWASRFAREANVLGKTIVLNGTKFTVVGVAPAHFEGFEMKNSAWIPSAMFRVGYRYCPIAERDCRVVALTGRLRPGKTPQDAQAELTVLARQLEAQFPGTNKGRGIEVRPALGADLSNREQGAQTIKVLGVAVGFVLWIACANVAGLLLVRGMRRRKEIVVRVALGASRRRLLQQLLTESLLLAFLGGVAGVVVAAWMNELVARFYNVTYSGLPLNFTMELNTPVLLCALALSAFSALLFGLVPAMQAGRLDLAAAMKNEGSAVTTRSRLRNALVIAQVTVSVVLLIGAGLVLRSLRSIYAGPGVDTGNVVLLRVRPTLLAYEGPKAMRFLQEAHRRVALLPGVLAASPADFNISPGFAGNTVTFWLPGKEPAQRELSQRMSFNRVGPQFFQTLGMALTEGRDFDEQDTAISPRVVILNDVLAQQAWPGESAIGKTVVSNGEAYRVVGVVRDAQYYNAQDAPRPFLYANFWQRDVQSNRTWDARMHVRVNGEPWAMLARIQREVGAVDAAVPVAEAYPLTERMRFEFASVRIAGTALTFFGAMGLALSAVGLYSVLAFAVSQRTREIGIRMALGARTSDVISLVLKQGVTLSVAGIAAGFVAALVGVRYLDGLLYGVTRFDVTSFAIAPVILLLAAALACWIPARRATRVDPMIALRYE